MELLACAKCHSIVDVYKRMRSLIALPHHQYIVIGRKCPACGHAYFVRRWSHEYVLKEDMT